MIHFLKATIAFLLVQGVFFHFDVQGNLPTYGDKVKICYQNDTYYVPLRKARRLIQKKGARLGNCPPSGIGLSRGASNPNLLLPIFEIKVSQVGNHLKVDLLVEKKGWVELVLRGVNGKRYEFPRPFWLKALQENQLNLPITQLPQGIYHLDIYTHNRRIHTEKFFIR